MPLKRKQHTSFAKSLREFLNSLSTLISALLLSLCKVFTSLEDTFRLNLSYRLSLLVQILTYTDEILPDSFLPRWIKVCCEEYMRPCDRQCCYHPLPPPVGSVVGNAAVIISHKLPPAGTNAPRGGYNGNISVTICTIYHLQKSSNNWFESYIKIVSLVS